jgi:hypothetical protein
MGPRWGLPHPGQRLTSFPFMIKVWPQEQVTPIFFISVSPFPGKIYYPVDITLKGHDSK